MIISDMQDVFSVSGKICDSCNTSTATIFCRVDTLSLCLSCDAKIHCDPTKMLTFRHERVWLCEVCEQAPAAFTCKADSAALCVSCDSDIHTANPFAQRHFREPIVPFYDFPDSGVKNSSALSFFESQNDDFDATQLIVSDSNVNSKGLLLHEIVAQFCDSEFKNSVGNDVVVPAASNPVSLPQPVNNYVLENCFEIDFRRKNISAFNFSNQSISPSMTSSEVGVVPDGNSMSDISFGQNLNVVPESSISVSGSGLASVSKSDREARVMRYREKRKNRRFEKTIRYASRKAYAETRPRIKGRFVKRTGIENELEQNQGSNSASYGVVPIL